MDDVINVIGDRVDLVKMDIEGGEERLLQGDISWLDRVDSIITEFHPGLVVHPYQELAEVIESAGFQWFPAGSLWPGSMDFFRRRRL